MRIRPIEQRDDEKIYHLIRRVLEEHQLNLPGTAYTDASLSALTAFYQTQPQAAYFVLEADDGQILGGAGVGPYSDGVCELQKLYLKKSARGQGYGRQLIETCLDFAKQHYQQIYLESHTNLAVALKVYEKMGFQKLTGHMNGGQHSLMNVWFVKTLN